MITILLICGLYYSPTLACRYNVRDIGFADLGSNSYYLFGYVNQDTPEQTVATFKQTVGRVLAESNVKFETVNIAKQKDHLAMKYFDSHKIKSFPAGILVSSDERSIIIPISASKNFQKTLLASIETVVSSEKRSEIINQAIDNYGIILVIEGTNAQENNSIKQMAQRAIKTITGRMNSLPKPIAKPPVLLVLTQDSFSTEKVLLWSLGIDTENLTQPHTVVLHGRGRMIGPILKGKEILEKKLTYILSAIGADCECGLDRKWMQGDMIPLVWNSEIQTRAAKILGFDPESPMIKMEMSRIIGRGQIRNNDPFKDLETFVGATGGYRELVVSFESDNKQDTIPQTTAKQIPPQTISPKPADNNPIAEEGITDNDEVDYSKSTIVLACLGVLVIITGAAIIIKAKRK